MTDPNFSTFLIKVASDYGLDINQKIDMNDPRTKILMATVITNIEQGRSLYSYDQFVKGCAAASGIDPEILDQELNPTSLGFENNSGLSGYVPPTLPSIVRGGSSIPLNFSSYIQAGLGTLGIGASGIGGGIFGSSSSVVDNASAGSYLGAGTIITGPLAPPGTATGAPGGLLGLIVQVESGGNYNAINYTATNLVPAGTNLTEMTISQIYALQASILANRTSTDVTSAVGGYQTVKATLEAAVNKLGLDPNTTKFDVTTQNLIGAQIAKSTGLDPTRLSNTWIALRNVPANQLAAVIADARQNGISTAPVSPSRNIGSAFNPDAVSTAIRNNADGTKSLTITNADGSIVNATQKADGTIVDSRGVIIGGPGLAMGAWSKPPTTSDMGLPKDWKGPTEYGPNGEFKSQTYYDPKDPTGQTYVTVDMNGRIIADPTGRYSSIGVEVIPSTTLLVTAPPKGGSEAVGLPAGWKGPVEYDSNGRFKSQTYVDPTNPDVNVKLSADGSMTATLADGSTKVIGTYSAGGYVFSTPLDAPAATPSDVIAIQSRINDLQKERDDLTSFLSNNPNFTGPQLDRLDQINSFLLPNAESVYAEMKAANPNLANIANIVPPSTGATIPFPANDSGTPAASTTDSVYNLALDDIRNRIDTNDAKIGYLENLDNLTVAQNLELNQLRKDNELLNYQAQDMENAAAVDSQSNLPSANYNDVNNVPYDPGTYDPYVLPADWQTAGTPGDLGGAPIDYVPGEDSGGGSFGAGIDYNNVG